MHLGNRGVPTKAPADPTAQIWPYRLVSTRDVPIRSRRPKRRIVVMVGGGPFELQDLSDVGPPTAIIAAHLGRPFCRRTSSQAASPEYIGTSISTETACVAWPIWGTAKSALAHLRHSPDADRSAFPCDCNELPVER